MKHISIFLSALFLPIAAEAAGSAIPIIHSWNGSLQVPDNNGTGASNTITISAPGLDRIESIIIGLAFSDGWNGDLYAYVVHDGELAILLNRPGRTATDEFGSGSTSLVALFDDTAAGDVHTSLPDSGPVSGVFQPDARMIDPADVLDTTPRTKFLSGFNNMDPNGDWTLFVADQSPGDIATLTSWSINLTAVPETSTALLLGVAAFALACSRKRRA